MKHNLEMGCVAVRGFRELAMNACPCGITSRLV